MSRIKIKNFGPIKEGYQEDDGWMDVKKVTVFIGNQGSGKSTVAKVISTLSWIEKAINRGDFSEAWSFHDFKTKFEYHGLRGYFKDETIIDYQGDLYSILYDSSQNRWPIITKKENSNYIVPKIMYVPDGRSFLSVIKNATGVRGLPYSLFDFAEELKRGQADTNGKEIQLPINGVNYKYESDTESSFIIGNDYKVNLLAASSGFQSLVPLFIVSDNLSKIVNNGTDISPANISVDQSIRMTNEISTVMLNNNLSDTEKIKIVNRIKGKFQNKAFINIVEEPEQNLFPSSQRQILNKLLEFNNLNDGNKLIITTHSPYLINYISLAVKADDLKTKVETDNLINKLNDIVPLNSTVNAKELVIYELNEADGSIKKLGSFDGIPSDKNFLNKSLALGNQLFDSLLEIEEEL